MAGPRGRPAGVVVWLALVLVCTAELQGRSTDLMEEVNELHAQLSAQQIQIQHLEQMLEHDHPKAIRRKLGTVQSTPTPTPTPTPTAPPLRKWGQGGGFNWVNFVGGILGDPFKLQTFIYGPDSRYISNRGTLTWLSLYTSIFVTMNVFLYFLIKACQGMLVSRMPSIKIASNIIRGSTFLTIMTWICITRFFRLSLSMLLEPKAQFLLAWTCTIVVGIIAFLIFAGMKQAELKGTLLTSKFESSYASGTGDFRLPRQYIKEQISKTYVQEVIVLQAPENGKVTYSEELVASMGGKSEGVPKNGVLLRAKLKKRSFSKIFLAIYLAIGKAIAAGMFPFMILFGGMPTDGDPRPDELRKVIQKETILVKAPRKMWAYWLAPANETHEYGQVIGLLTTDKARAASACDGHSCTELEALDRAALATNTILGAVDEKKARGTIVERDFYLLTAVVFPLAMIITAHYLTLEVFLRDVLKITICDLDDRVSNCPVRQDAPSSYRKGTLSTSDGDVGGDDDNEDDNGGLGYFGAATRALKVRLLQAAKQGAEPSVEETLMEAEGGGEEMEDMEGGQDEVGTR